MVKWYKINKNKYHVLRAYGELQKLPPKRFLDFTYSGKSGQVVSRERCVTPIIELIFHLVNGV